MEVKPKKSFLKKFEKDIHPEQSDRVETFHDSPSFLNALLDATNNFKASDLH